MNTNQFDFSKYDSDDVISATSKYRHDLSTDLIKGLTPILNNLHNVNHSERFWRIILNEYLNSVITKKRLMENKDFYDRLLVFPINSFTTISLSNNLKKIFVNLSKHIISNTKVETINTIVKNNDDLCFSFPIQQNSWECYLPNSPCKEPP